MTIKKVFVVLALGIMFSGVGGFAFAADLGGDEPYDFNSSSWYLEPDNSYNSSSWYLEPEYNSSSWYLEPEYNSSSWYLEPEYNSSSWYLEPNYGCYDCGSSYGGYGGGYGGYSYRPTYTTPGCTGCGGGYYTIAPRPSTPVSGGGSQSQSQSQVSNNTNTNVNVNNNTAIAVAQVQIGSQQASTPTHQPAPYCTIYQAQYGNYGNAVYLSWTSSNASSAYLSGHGSVAVNGSQTVYTSGYQIYTLTVYGYNGQQATCQTTVQKTVTPYVSLTQIPYTGFDFGPFGNAMYWAGMIVFALAGAYLAVYFIPSLAFAGTKRGFAPVVAPKAPILVEKEAALEKIAPVVASLKKAGTNDAMAIVKSNDGSMPKIVIERF